MAKTLASIFNLFCNLGIVSSASTTQPPFNFIARSTNLTKKKKKKKVSSLELNGSHPSLPPKLVKNSAFSFNHPYSSITPTISSNVCHSFDEVVGCVGDLEEEHGGGCGSEPVT